MPVAPRLSDWSVLEMTATVSACRSRRPWWSTEEAAYGDCHGRATLAQCATSVGAFWTWQTLDICR
jgi:hypothetical protein